MYDKRTKTRMTSHTLIRPLHPSQLLHFLMPLHLEHEYFMDGFILEEPDVLFP